MGLVDLLRRSTERGPSWEVYDLLTLAFRTVQLWSCGNQSGKSGAAVSQTFLVFMAMWLRFGSTFTV